MSTKAIVILREENGGDYGEIKVFDTVDAAERHIESLLEKGFESKSIRLLDGCEREFVVRQRPVVSALPVDQASVTVPWVDESADTANVVVTDGPREQAELVAVGADERNQPYTRDGVRFSSIFGRD